MAILSTWFLVFKKKIQVNFAKRLIHILFTILWIPLPLSLTTWLWMLHCQLAKFDSPCALPKCFSNVRNSNFVDYPFYKFIIFCQMYGPKEKTTQFYRTPNGGLKHWFLRLARVYIGVWLIVNFIHHPFIKSCNRPLNL